MPSASLRGAGHGSVSIEGKTRIQNADKLPPRTGRVGATPSLLACPGAIAAIRGRAATRSAHTRCTSLISHLRLICCCCVRLGLSQSVFSTSCPTRRCHNQCTVSRSSAAALAAPLPLATRRCSSRGQLEPLGDHRRVCAILRAIERSVARRHAARHPSK